MDSIKFSTEEKILHRLILNANNPNIPSGLLRGKCGIALVLAHYSRERKKKVLENVVSYIPKENLENLNILKIENDKFDMDKFISTVSENLDEAINKNLIAIFERLLYNEQNTNTSEARMAINHNRWKN